MPMASSTTEAWQLLPELKDMVMQYVEQVPKYNGGVWTYRYGRREPTVYRGSEPHESLYFYRPEAQTVYWCFKCRRMCLTNEQELQYIKTEPSNLTVVETKCSSCQVSHFWMYPQKI